MNNLSQTKRKIIAGLTLALGFVCMSNGQMPVVAVEHFADEIVVSADFTGNGLVDTVVVDRKSGAYRFGRQVSAQVIQWQPLEATGVANITDATAGRILTTTRKSLAVTSPDANAVHILDVLNPASAPVLRYLPSVVGPSSLTSAQLVGASSLQDFAIATEYGPDSIPFSLGFYGMSGATVLALPAPSFLTATTAHIGQLQRVALSATLPDAVGYVRDDGAQACIEIVNMNAAGLPVLLTVCALPTGVRYHMARFGTSALGTLITYQPGQSSFMRHTLASDGGSGYVVASQATIATPFPLGHLAVIKGGTQARLALLSDDGYELVIYDFDGTGLGAMVQQIFAASASEPIAAVASYGNQSGLLVLRRDPALAASAAADFYDWNVGSGQFENLGSQTFQPAGPRSGMANVTLMSGEPFVDGTARPILLRNARDWTSGTPPTLPGSVTVTAEQWLGESAGLGAPVSVNLGSSPSGASYALLNQYAAPISIFTLSRASGNNIGHVGISPDSGLYDRSIELRFDSLPAGLSIYFRDLGGNWQSYVELGPEPDVGTAAYTAWFADFRNLVRYKDTVIEYFGEDAFGRRTPIRRAEFSFTEPPDSLSTLGDGVPDYVKLGLGLNPFRLPDGDASAGIGNALQAVLAGSGIPPRRLSGSAVDVYVRPLAHNGSNPFTASRLATNPLSVLPDGTLYGGNQIFARSLGGAPVGQGRDPIPATTDRNEGLGIYAPFAEPSAYLTSLTGEESGLFLMTTRPSYALAGTLPPPSIASSVGREMIGLLSLQGITAADYSRTYTGGSLSAEANAWLTGATAFYASTPLPQVAYTIDAYETVAALLFERWLAQRMVDRGLLSAGYMPPAPDASSPPPLPEDYLTLTAHRTREGARPMASATSGALSPTPEALRAVASWDPVHPAYDLSAAAAAIRDFVRNSTNTAAVALRTVVMDVYRISAAHGNSFPGAFDPPVDVLRQFTATGSLPDPYLPGFGDLTGAPFTTLAASVYANAVAGIGMATAAPAPRSSLWVQVEFDANSFATPGCVVVHEAFAPGNLFTLFNADGRAFRLPANFAVLPGTRLFVRGFTDTAFVACAGTPLEVIEFGGSAIAEVQLLPTGSAADTDGNLLGDEWELAFFGTTGIDPWADPNGDGYTYLQKYLDGKDPFLPPSYTSVPPANLALPVLHVDGSTPGQITISFDFPEPYAGQMQFQVYEDPTLSGNWLPAPYPITSPASGSFEVTIPFGTSVGFWQVGMSLP